MGCYATPEWGATPPRSTQDQTKINPQIKPHARAGDALPLDIEPEPIDAEIVTDDAETPDAAPATPTAIEVYADVAAQRIADAELIAAFIEKRFAQNGAPQKRTRKWTQVVAKHLSREGVSREHVAAVADYATRDKFWSGKVHSIDTFDRNFNAVAVALSAEKRPEQRRKSRTEAMVEEMRAYNARNGRPAPDPVPDAPSKLDALRARYAQPAAPGRTPNHPR